MVGVRRDQGCVLETELRPQCEAELLTGVPEKVSQEWSRAWASF